MRNLMLKKSLEYKDEEELLYLLIDTINILGKKHKSAEGKQIILQIFLDVQGLCIEYGKQGKKETLSEGFAYLKEGIERIC